MTLSKKIACFMVLPVFFVVAVLVFLPGPIIKWAMEYYGTQTLGAQVDVGEVEFSWIPTTLEVRRVDITNPMQTMQNALSITRLSTTLDIASSLKGTVHLSELWIEGITVGAPRQRSGAVSGIPPHIPFVTPEGQVFKLPAVQVPDMDSVVDKEKALYGQRAQAFEQQLKNTREQWDTRLKTLPDQARLATYKQRWDEIRAAKDPVSRLASLGKLKTLQQDIKADLEQFKQVDRDIKQEWQGLQTHYASLKNLSAESLVGLLESWGLSDSMLTGIGRLLVQDKVNEWLNNSLGFQQLLSAKDKLTAKNNTAESAAPDLRTQPLVFIKKTMLSGPLVHGSRQGEVTGEVLNLSDAPHLVADPITLRMDAKGTTLGALQLSGLLDHRVIGKERDTFNFSLKNSQLQDFMLSDRPELQVRLKKAALSMDVAGTLQQMSKIDLNLRSAFKSLSLDVQGKSADNEIVTALTDALQSVPSIAIAAVAKGNLPRPDVSVTNNLDEVVASALRKVLDKKMAGFREKLQTRLNEELQKQIARLEDDLAKNNALLDQAALKGADFESLLKDLKI